MWTNTVKQDRPQMTIWRMRIACWIPTVTDTHSQYVILIAFPRQQLFRESASMIRSYVHCLCVCIFFFTFQIVYQFTCSVQKQPDNSKDDRSVQHTAPSGRNVFHVTLLASRISRWFLDFRKMWTRYRLHDTLKVYISTRHTTKCLMTVTVLD
jgi:hypothetical protein